MYEFLGKHIYPEGYVYSGRATECYYSFYASKNFYADEIYDHIISQSDMAANEQGATMLVNRVWLDRTGANNLFAVKFDGHGPAVGAGISGVSWAIPVWVVWVILVCVVFGFVSYIVKTIRDISYSPAGEEMWSAIKWIAIGVSVVVAIPLIDRVIPKSREKR